MGNNKIKKTNATRILDKLNIDYNMHDYPQTDIALSGLQVAEYLNKDPQIIFKTLVLKGDKTSFIVAIVPSSFELDLKKLAKQSNNKKVEMILSKDLKPQTGYVHGGCSPLGMKKIFPTYINESCLDYKTILVSAGEVGKQIELKASDLIRAIDAIVIDLVAK